MKFIFSKILGEKEIIKNSIYELFPQPFELKEKILKKYLMEVTEKIKFHNKYDLMLYVVRSLYSKNKKITVYEKHKTYDLYGLDIGPNIKFSPNNRYDSKFRNKYPGLVSPENFLRDYKVMKNTEDMIVEANCLEVAMLLHKLLSFYDIESGVYFDSDEIYAKLIVKTEDGNYSLKDSGNGFVIDTVEAEQLPNYWLDQKIILWHWQVFHAVVLGYQGFTEDSIYVLDQLINECNEKIHDLGHQIIERKDNKKLLTELMNSSKDYTYAVIQKAKVYARARDYFRSLETYNTNWINYSPSSLHKVSRDKKDFFENIMIRDVNITNVRVLESIIDTCLEELSYSEQQLPCEILRTKEAGALLNYIRVYLDSYFDNEKDSKYIDKLPELVRERILKKLYSIK